MMENNRISRTGSERRPVRPDSAQTVRRREAEGERPRRSTRTAGTVQRSERSSDRPVRTGESSRNTERVRSERDGRRTTERVRGEERVRRSERVKDEEPIRSVRSGRTERRGKEAEKARTRSRQRTSAAGIAALKPQDTRDYVMLGVKAFMLIFLVVYIVKIYGMGQAKDVPLQTIEDKMIASTDVSALTKGGVIDLKRSYSLSADDLDEYILYSADSLMDVSELLIIKVKNPDQLPAVRQAAERHLDTEKEKFDGYGTNQYDLLEHAIVLEKGRYLFCAVSENEKQWEEVFLSCVG